MVKMFLKKDIIALLKSYIKLGCTVYVWSGGGMKYVENVCRKLGIENLVIMSPKRGIIPDITYDDQEVNLGGINIQVRPKMY